MLTALWAFVAVWNFVAYSNGRGVSRLAFAICATVIVACRIQDVRGF